MNISCCDEYGGLWRVAILYYIIYTGQSTGKYITHKYLMSQMLVENERTVLTGNIWLGYELYYSVFVFHMVSLRS